MQKLVTELRWCSTVQGLPDSRRVAARVRLDAAGVGEHLPKSARWPAVTRPVAEFRPTATVLVELAGGAVLVEKDVSGAINLGAQRARLAKDLATA